MSQHILPAVIQGTVEPRFEEVKRTFEENFARRGEVGAACAVWHRGRFVVDLWAGLKDPATGAPWERDTMVLVYSATKGMAAACFAVAHARGLFRYDDPVTKWWPEFAAHGKERLTIRDVLEHRAGIPYVDRRIDVMLMRDHAALAKILAEQRPHFAPGTRTAYHAITFGWLAQTLLTRIDPAHRTLGRFFAEEIAKTLGAEFHIGLPRELDPRMATIVDFGILASLRSPSHIPIRFAARLLTPGSVAARALRNPRVSAPSEFANEAFRRLEMPSTNGIGEVRALARVYGELASGGAALGLDAATNAELRRVPTSAIDAVTGLEMRYSIGFSRPAGKSRFGSDAAFGTSGLGGAFGFGDPATGLGYAYAPNRLGIHLRDDPRERALREATLRCV